MSRFIQVLPYLEINFFETGFRIQLETSSGQSPTLYFPE